jgi:hypothetical protein
MPNRKTLFILIICFGIVTSVYLFARNSNNLPLLAGNDTAISANSYINIGKNTNNDWQKILTNVDPNQNTTTVLTTGGDPNVFDETSLTAQMSRDMFAQYLLVANKPGGVTSDDATQIASAVLSNPEYTKTASIVYTDINLHVVNTSKDSVKKYTEEMNQIIINYSSQVKVNPLNILLVASESEDEKELAKLDPIILVAKSFISGLIKIDVPRDAVQAHLDLMNSSSNLLSDLEAARVTFTDPVRGLTGIGQYVEHLTGFQTATNNINAYLAGKN